MSRLNNTPKLAILKLGKYSTQFYLQRLSQLNIKLIETDFKLINANLPNNFAQLELLLRPYLEALIEDKSISRILIPNITLHETLDKLYSDFPLPYVHPIKDTIEEIKQHKHNEVILIGSLYSMNAPYIQDYFAKHSIKVLKPSEKEQLFIDNYRKKIYAGAATEFDNIIFNDILYKYQKKTSIIIACTELSIQTSTKQSAYCCYNMALIQIKNALSALASTASLIPDFNEPLPF